MLAKAAHAAEALEDKDYARGKLALARLFAVKGRPTDHPVIVHVARAAQLDDLGRDVPDVAHALAKAFWPGPLTLAVRRNADRVAPEATGGRDTVGIRVPDHPVARAVLDAFGGGIAAPSANRYGRLSPTKPEHVRDELGAAVHMMLDGGDSPIGLESTIVSCLDGEVRLLRPGFITRSQIQQVVGELTEGGEAPRVPGDRVQHYAPSTPLEIVPWDDLEARAGEILALDEKVAVLAMRPPVQDSATEIVAPRSSNRR